MTYFCSCACSKSNGEPGNEETLIFLPRNLSYAGESYLDRYSVSSTFVHNSELEKQLLHADVEYQRYLRARASLRGDLRSLDQLELDQNTWDKQDVFGGSSAHLSSTVATAPAGKATLGHMSGISSTSDMESGTDPVAEAGLCRPALSVNIDRSRSTDPALSDFDRYVVKTVESPDSDLVSEEGIFVNMMDDLDVLGAVGGKNTLSETSEDTCVSGDSMYYSPQEVEMEGEHSTGRFRLSLEEAVKQAADRLQPENTPSPQSADPGQQVPDAASQADTQGPKSLEEQTPTDGSYPPEKLDQTIGRSVDGELCKLAGNLKITVNDKPLKSEGRQLSSSYRELVSPESPVYEDREFNFTRAELRKSASLKSSKTPPGTPRRKKVVRFADAMGLDLESVRHVLNLDSPPKIPASAMKDLQPGLSEDRKDIGTKFITETFRQPGADIGFPERVMVEKVSLENAVVVSGSITGVVRVANIAFHKKVRVRFTTNGWSSFHDIAASYMQNSSVGGMDRFSFTLVPPAEFVPGSKLEFAVSFSVQGAEFWDNNRGENYVFECYAKTVPTDTENAWMHFL